MLFVFKESLMKSLNHMKSLTKKKIVNNLPQTPQRLKAREYLVNLINTQDITWKDILNNPEHKEQFLIFSCGKENEQTFKNLKSYTSKISQTKVKKDLDSKNNITIKTRTTKTITTNKKVNLNASIEVLKQGIAERIPLIQENEQNNNNNININVSEQEEINKSVKTKTEIFDVNIKFSREHSQFIHDTTFSILEDIKKIVQDIKNGVNGAVCYSKLSSYKMVSDVIFSLEKGYNVSVVNDDMLAARNFKPVEGEETEELKNQKKIARLLSIDRPFK